jgi:cell division protein FtsN
MPTPDAADAHAEFLTRRRRRYQRLVTGTALAAVLALTAGALALANHHTSKTVPVAANGRIGEPQPGPGETALLPSSNTTATSSVAPGPTPSTTERGSAVTTRPASPPITASHPTTSSTAPATGPGPLPPGTFVATNADDGKTYVLKPGQHLTVHLDSDGYVWSEPDSSNSLALPRDDGRTASDGSAWATFTARALGNADVTSEGRSIPPPCATATPRCMVPDHVAAFKVNVRVVA